jgi:hypothetical protein
VLNSLAGKGKSVIVFVLNCYWQWKYLLFLIDKYRVAG